MQRSITGFSGPLFGSLNHVWHLVERAAQVRIALQDGRQQKSVPSAYIYDGSNTVKIVRFGDRRAINHGKLGRGVIDNLPFRGMLLQKIENVRAVDMVQRLLSCSDAILQVRPAAPVPFPASHGRKSPQAPSRIGAQNRRHRRLRKLSVRPLREHSNAGSGAHETVERLWISSHLLCQFLRRFGGRLDKVRDAELCEARDSARDVSPRHKLENADVCRRSLGLRHHWLFT